MRFRKDGIIYALPEKLVPKVLSSKSLNSILTAFKNAGLRLRVVYEVDEYGNEAILIDDWEKGVYAEFGLNLKAKYIYISKRSLGYAEPILTFLGLKPPKVEGSIRVEFKSGPKMFVSVERKVPEIIEGEERQDWLIIEAEFDERFNEKVNEILKRYMGLYEKAKKLNIEIRPTLHPNGTLSFSMMFSLTLRKAKSLIGLNRKM